MPRLDRWWGETSSSSSSLGAWRRCRTRRWCSSFSTYGASSRSSGESSSSGSSSKGIYFERVKEPPLAPKQLVLHTAFRIRRCPRTFYTSTFNRQPVTESSPPAPSFLALVWRAPCMFFFVMNSSRSGGNGDDQIRELDGRVYAVDQRARSQDIP